MKQISYWACTVLLFVTLAAPAQSAGAAEPPRLLFECAAGAAALKPVFQPLARTGAVAGVATTWLEQAAALPDPQARAAYVKAVNMTVSSLRQAGVAARPLDVLIYRFTALEAHRREIRPVFQTGGGRFTLVDRIDRELELIAELLPPECLF